jgi:hypothetical protein
MYLDVSENRSFEAKASTLEAKATKRRPLCGVEDEN